ncbi:MAG: hypothetical protein P8013_11370 [Candidatus Sulfobium sp.]
MNKAKLPEENINIVKQELISVTKKLDELCRMEKDLRDLKLEIKGLKLFLERVYPEFGSEFPAIMGKMSKKT